MSFLSVDQLTKMENGNRTVDAINFDLQKGERLGIAGETGSGKTTLLRMIAGLIQPDAGDTRFNDERIAGPLEKLIPGHKGIAYLSQHFELRNNFFIHEILEMANVLPGQHASRLYELCRITHLLKRRSTDLSGGEKQRVALAGTISTNPELLILDEPFSNLDWMHKSIVKAVIEEITTQLQVTVILVTQDPIDLLAWSDRILVMRNGRLIQEGIPETLYHRPLNEYCAGLFGNYSLLTLGASPGQTIKRFFSRPEYFTIDTDSSNAIAGTIRAVSFQGSHYLLDVTIGNENVLVSSLRADHAVGAEIRLSLPIRENWWM